MTRTRPRRKRHAGAPGATHSMNMTQSERFVALMGGTLVAAWGLRRRDAAGAVAVLIGGVIAFRGLGGHSHLYERMGVHRFSGARGRGNVIRGQAIRVERSVTVQRPVDEVYRFWRSFENLPLFMEHLVEVTPRGGGIYRWTARGPIGTVRWDAEIVEEQVPWLLSWRSIPGSQVDNAGSVRFSPAPGGRGTEVQVSLAYKPPVGVLGAVVARMLGRDPGVQVADDLDRFKRILEAGESPVDVTR